MEWIYQKHKSRLVTVNSFIHMIFQALDKKKNTLPALLLTSRLNIPLIGAYRASFLSSHQVPNTSQSPFPQVGLSGTLCEQSKSFSTCARQSLSSKPLLKFPSQNLYPETCSPNPSKNHPNISH
ncbi:hypothetical protein M758_6G149700 [Ceratodon purpureus]|nr:hypothetical protein M758_6G149700 [Ceratodon purpureus]